MSRPIPHGGAPVGTVRRRGGLGRKILEISTISKEYSGDPGIPSIRCKPRRRRIEDVCGDTPLPPAFGEASWGSIEFFGWWLMWTGIKVAVKMSVLERPGAGKVKGRSWCLLGGCVPGCVFSRTPEAARSGTSTVVLSVVVDVAAAEGGGVIVAVVVPGLSGVYLCRAFLHVPCESGFAVARQPWWLHASSCPSFVVGRSVGPSAVDDVVLGASGASPGSPKTLYDASLGGF